MSCSLNVSSLSVTGRFLKAAGRVDSSGMNIQLGYAKRCLTALVLPFFAVLDALFSVLLLGTYEKYLEKSGHKLYPLQTACTSILLIIQSIFIIVATILSLDALPKIINPKTQNTSDSSKIHDSFHAIKIKDVKLKMENYLTNPTSDNFKKMSEAALLNYHLYGQKYDNLFEEKHSYLLSLLRFKAPELLIHKIVTNDHSVLFDCLSLFVHSSEFNPSHDHFHSLVTEILNSSKHGHLFKIDLNIRNQDGLTAIQYLVEILKILQICNANLFREIKLLKDLGADMSLQEDKLTWLNEKEISHDSAESYTIVERLLSYGFPIQFPINLTNITYAARSEGCPLIGKYINTHSSSLTFKEEDRESFGHLLAYVINRRNSLFRDQIEIAKFLIRNLPTEDYQWGGMRNLFNDAFDKSLQLNDVNERESQKLIWNLIHEYSLYANFKSSENFFDFCSGSLGGEKPKEEQKEDELKKPDLTKLRATEDAKNYFKLLREIRQKEINSILTSIMPRHFPLAVVPTISGYLT